MCYKSTCLILPAYYGKGYRDFAKGRATHKNNLNRLPTLALSFNDVASMRSIIRAYITYTRRVSQPTREREERIHVLESLYLRLANMPTNVTDVALLLSVAEVAALDCALAGFCAFVHRKVSPSRERDETLQDVERMRQVLARML